MLVLGLLKIIIFLIFEESIMSVTPTKPKQRTQFLIKDILFQEKYKLSSTEVDLMSYIFNSMTWAFKVEGYLTITSKKFTDDLPHIGMKTVEASLRTLKQMELVEVEMIYHPIWKSNVRGIRITSRGMEYGMKLYKPSEQKIKERYESEIASYQTQLTEKNTQLQILQRRFQAMNDSSLDNPKEEIKPQAEGFGETIHEPENSYTIQTNAPFVEHPTHEETFIPPEFEANIQGFQYSDEYIDAEAEAQAQYEEEIEEIYQEMAEIRRADSLSTMMEDYAREDALKEQREEEAYERAKSISEAIAPVQEPKVEVEEETVWTPENQEEPIAQTPEVEQEVEAEKTETERVIEKPTPKEPKQRIFEKDFEMFIAGIKRDYGHTSEPICNRVGNGWAKETTFYINSYGKLSIVTEADKSIQIKEPERIHQFWKWLFVNQDRIDDVFDFKKHKADINLLNRKYRGTKLLVGDIKVKIHKIVPKGDGVALKLKDKKSGRVGLLTNDNKPIIYTPYRCEEIILRFRR
jgi:hypothetical protein